MVVAQHIVYLMGDVLIQEIVRLYRDLRIESTYSPLIYGLGIC